VVDIDVDTVVCSSACTSLEFKAAAITLILPAVTLATFLSAFACIESGSESIMGLPLSLPSMICGDNGISPRKGILNFSLIFLASPFAKNVYFLAAMWTLKIAHILNYTYDRNV
jgi:hypothetical protein